MSISAVIMAGGVGARLWPLSRATHPKQFLQLYDQDTLLQSTLTRVSKFNLDSTLVICNEEHRFFVAEQLRQNKHKGSIILEPEGRNTAPAVALAALNSDKDSYLLVLSSDHIIKEQEIFAEAIEKAIPLAEDGKLVTFGIVPSVPSSGYGYIKRGSKIKSGFIVDKFVEKPNKDKAKEYISDNQYYWNSGIFLFKASRYLEELKKFRPDILESCIEATKSSEHDLDFIRVGENAFKSCDSESIDYAVMEKTSDAVVVPMDAGWSDVGSWSALWDISDKDENENVIKINEDNISYNNPVNILQWKELIENVFSGISLGLSQLENNEDLAEQQEGAQLSLPDERR